MKNLIYIIGLVPCIAWGQLWIPTNGPVHIAEGANF